MIKDRFYDFSLQGKISSIYILANIFVLLANFVLLFVINSMSQELEKVYQENLTLNELSEGLTSVQENMTEYLNVKTTEALENYYRSEQDFYAQVQNLSSDISSVTFKRMERNIRNMSQQYIDAVGQTIEAKRGRNVEKYRIRYENATDLYEYINSYIYSLNIEQFINNSENYNALSKVFRVFEFVSMFIMAAVIIGNVILIINFTGNLISPLRKLAGQADEVARGNFDIELTDYKSHDEIGVVTNAFNQMVISIRQYIGQIQERMEIERQLKEKELLMEAHLKDAQLKYLQAQINPHFLFNTLNAGAQLAMMEEADKTYEYIQEMAEFFRYNVKKGNDIVTVKDEIELVDNYIYILNVRFSGDIHYEKSIEEKVLDAPMPSMILQPIIENCINHGIREMAGKGKIWLTAFSFEGQPCISIRDNGIGMSAETIEKVLAGTYREEELSGDSNGIGMNNIIVRLQLFTETEDVIDIISEGKNMGTEVRIYLKPSAREDKHV
ncbi:MAG: histidine kinase [Lachnospiraceae bacterium]|nr:histidine kinase [Lachnospiraceae bacterium]